MIMSENICQTCKHFRQHFTRRNHSYIEVDCGHCVYPRVKTRKPETPACKHFAALEKNMPRGKENGKNLV